LLGIPMIGLGGYGAAIAAVLGFGVVFLARALDIRKKVRYNQRFDKIVLSSCVILLQVVLSYFSPRWQFLGHMAGLFIIFAINANSLVEAIFYISSKLNKNKSKS